MNAHKKINITPPLETDKIFKNSISDKANHIFQNHYSSKHILTDSYEQLRSYYDPYYQALWVTADAFPASVFTYKLLKSIRTLQDKIATVYFSKPQYAPRYIIWKSSNTSAFNLGLDLSYIVQLLHERDEMGLNNYLQLFIDVFFINQIKLDVKPIVTLTLIRGKAYGSGFESALTSSLIFAESGAKCCFPELHNSLLPSLGTIWTHAKNLNLNRLKNSASEQRFLSLTDLHDKGIIYKIFASNCGEELIKNYIQNHHHNYESLFCAIQKKSQPNLITLSKLEKIKSSWLESLRHLTSKEVAILEKMAIKQIQLSATT